MKRLLTIALLLVPSYVWSDTSTSGNLKLLRPSVGVVDPRRTSGDKLNSNFEIIDTSFTTLQNGVLASTTALASNLQGQINGLSTSQSTQDVLIQELNTTISTQTLHITNTNYLSLDGSTQTKTGGMALVGTFSGSTVSAPTYRGQMVLISTITGNMRNLWIDNVGQIGFQDGTTQRTSPEAMQIGVYGSTGALKTEISTTATAIYNTFSTHSTHQDATLNFLSTAGASMLAVNNFLSTTGVQIRNLNLFTSTSDAQQTKFVNFRTTTDASIASIPSGDSNYKVFTVYLSTSGSQSSISDIQGSFTTNYHKALEIFQSAGIGQASTSPIKGTIYMGRGDYYWNQGTTVPSNVSLVCSDSTTIHTTITTPFIYVWGNMENCVLTADGSSYGSKFLNIMSSSTGNNVALRGAGNFNQNGVDDMTLIRAADINNARWTNLIVDQGWVGSQQDVTRNGGLLTFLRSTDTHIHFKYVSSGTFATTGKQCIGWADNYRTSLTGDDVTLGARGIYLHNNSAGSGPSGSLAGMNNKFSFKKLTYANASGTTGLFYAECYNASGGGCYSTGTAIVDSTIINESASAAVIRLIISGQSSSTGLLIDNVNFYQTHPGAVTFLIVGTEFKNTRFQNSRLYGVGGGALTPVSDSGVDTNYTGNQVILNYVEQ